MEKSKYNFNLLDNKNLSVINEQKQDFSVKSIMNNSNNDCSKIFSDDNTNSAYAKTSENPFTNNQSQHKSNLLKNKSESTRKVHFIDSVNENYNTHNNNHSPPINLEAIEKLIKKQSKKPPETMREKLMKKFSSIKNKPSMKIPKKSKQSSKNMNNSSFGVVNKQDLDTSSISNKVNMDKIRTKLKNIKNQEFESDSNKFGLQRQKTFINRLYTGQTKKLKVKLVDKEKDRKNLIDDINVKKYKNPIKGKRGKDYSHRHHNVLIEGNSNNFNLDGSDSFSSSEFPDFLFNIDYYQGEKDKVKSYIKFKKIWESTPILMKDNPTRHVDQKLKYHEVKKLPPDQIKILTKIKNIRKPISFIKKF